MKILKIIFKKEWKIKLGSKRSLPIANFKKDIGLMKDMFGDKITKEFFWCETKYILFMQKR